MLNTLTSLLRGSAVVASEEGGEIGDPQAPLPEPPTPGDYLLVHPNAKENQGPEEEWIFVDTKDVQFEADECDYPISMPTSTEPSAPGTPGSGGWNMTPPACFNPSGRGSGAGSDRSGCVVAHPPGILETSNFENLLIEHPSRSIYVRRGTKDAHAHSGIDADADSSSSTAGSEQAAVAGAGRYRRSIPLAEWLPPHLFGGAKTATAVAGQAELATSHGACGGRKMERSNKAREQEATSNRRACRKKRMAKNFSGANNDRKCQ